MTDEELDGLPPELIAQLSLAARGQAVNRDGYAPAFGQKQGDKVRVAVSFDPECFDRIRRIAVDRHISLGKVIRRLVEVGLQVQDWREANDPEH